MLKLYKIYISFSMLKTRGFNFVSLSVCVTVSVYFILWCLLVLTWGPGLFVYAVERVCGCVCLSVCLFVCLSQTQTQT